MVLNNAGERAIGPFRGSIIADWIQISRDMFVGSSIINWYPLTRYGILLM